MKKLSIILLASVMLAACGEEDAKQEEELANGTTGDSSTEEPAEEVSEETTEDSETEEEPASEEEVVEPAGFLAYIPAAGLVKNFEVDSFELTRTVLEVKDNKVLEEITFGDVKTIQISEWTESGMKMLYNTGETEGITDISIDGIEPTSEPIVMIDEANSTEGEWLVVSKEETLELPAGTFENVTVIEQVLKSESSDQVTTLTQYFAPELGFVKEKTVITNGEKEDISEVNLVSFE
ncbi:hypothetical protein DHX103_03935 [Planococcus sp. X10-3]|uniref:hypothetical protein n=1 Tax=Planococcus sp. X10-3 TaxID=3061240 RepID=UPI003BAE6CAC